MSGSYLRTDDVSPALRAHLAGGIERPDILAAVRRFAARLPAGARVLDAGAGSAPFREIFAAAGCEYLTSDWANSPHPEAHAVDIVAPLDSLPVAGASFDAVLCTQVLEHVEHPPAALRELRRVLVPGGRLLVTVPFTGELHEEPYDFFRFTPHSLRSMLATAGFAEIEVEPMGGAFGVAAHLVKDWIAVIGATGRVARILEPVMWRLGPRLVALDRFDRRRVLCLGYAVEAVAGPGGEPA